MKTKKRSSSQITPRGYGPFASFRGTILVRGESTFIAWRGATNLMVRISVFAHKFRGNDQKKKNLKFRLGVHSCFSPWNETLLTLDWVQAVFWGEGTGPERPKCTSVAPGLLLSFGHNPRLGGNSSDLRTRPRNAPGGAGPGQISFYDSNTPPFRN